MIFSCLKKQKTVSFTGDGGAAVPLPTHYYIIASYCNNTELVESDCDNATVVLSLVLPHLSSSANCWVSYSCSLQHLVIFTQIHLRYAIDGWMDVWMVGTNIPHDNRNRSAKRRRKNPPFWPLAAILNFG
jgi:hypothetical protein